LVESTHTFTGHIKPLFYLENKDKFKKFHDKIIHIVNDMPYKYPDINYSFRHQNINENYQRECIKNGINKLKNIINDEDVIIFSDLDEIPNPNILKNVINKTIEIKNNTFYRLECDMYYYNLNLREGNGSNWHGIKLIPYFYYRNTNLSMQEIRVFEYTNYIPIIKNGGWHLSYFGNETFIYNKLVNFKEMEKQHENACHNLKIDNIIDKIKNGINILTNTSLVYIPIEENRNLPYKYDTYLTKFFIIEK
jgi:beta-1,4-mannosyl-glycoprotein beta-1,4-N-acetylglucosaminyltransferase